MACWDKVYRQYSPGAVVYLPLRFRVVARPRPSISPRKTQLYPMGFFFTFQVWKFTEMLSVLLEVVDL